MNKHKPKPKYQIGDIMNIMSYEGEVHVFGHISSIHQIHRTDRTGISTHPEPELLEQWKDLGDHHFKFSQGWARFMPAQKGDPEFKSYIWPLAIEPQNKRGAFPYTLVE